MSEDTRPHWIIKRVDGRDSGLAITGIGRSHQEALQSLLSIARIEAVEATSIVADIENELHR